MFPEERQNNVLFPRMAAENVCGAPSAVSATSREYYCSVMMCFYCHHHPSGRDPLHSRDACCFTLAGSA